MAHVAQFKPRRRIFGGFDAEDHAPSTGSTKKHTIIKVVEDPDVVEEARQRDRYRVPHDFE